MLDINDYQPYNLYTSWDDGAPALTREAHSAQVVLKACLVEGYGSKRAAGWDMADDDINGRGIRSFRPRGINDTGCTYRISDDIATAFTLEAFHKDSPVAFAKRRISKTMYNVGATNPAWILLANDESCWWMIQKDASQPYYAVIYFGNRYSTAAPYRAGCIFVGEESYVEYNYSLYADDAQGRRRQQQPRAAPLCRQRPLRRRRRADLLPAAVSQHHRQQRQHLFARFDDGAGGDYHPGQPRLHRHPAPGGRHHQRHHRLGGFNESAWALGRTL